jgi:hypothetical protein
LATSDDEVDLAVGLLKRAIGVASFRWWWWSSFLLVVVVVIVVVLATSTIASVISLVVALVVVAITTMITPVIVTPVIAVIAMVAIASVIAVVVAAIITSIPVIIARIGPAVTVISSIRSAVMVVETLATVSAVIVVAPGLLGGRRYSKGALQLFALSHGVLRVTVKLALVVHDHVEVAFEEGGRSWRIRHIGLARSLARPGASVVVVFPVEVMHDRILSVN